MTDFPDYAHCPGINPRHPEDMFEQICNTVTPNMTMSELGKSPAWYAGMDLYRNEFYWEAHEVLEAVWMQCPPNSVERNFVQAIIQLANARLKLTMERPKAAKRIFDQATELLGETRVRSSFPIFDLPVEFANHELETLAQKLESSLNPGQS